MNVTDLHRPTPEFRERLEWEVTRTLRRERRLADHRRLRGRGRFRTAAVVLAAIVLGSTAGLASAQIRDAARRDSLLEAAQAELGLARVRLELAQAQLDDARRRTQLGVPGAPSIAAAEAEQRAMQARALRVQLNIEEIRAAAQSPRDDLNAPLVAGRDFVTERLRLDLLAAQQRLLAAEEGQAEAERRLRVGAGSDLARLEAGLEVGRARAAMAALAEVRNLRAEFLERGTAIEELLRRRQVAELRQDVLLAQQAVSVARERLLLLERRRAVGAAQELEVLRARVLLREREMELQLLGRRLRGGASPPAS